MHERAVGGGAQVAHAAPAGSHPRWPTRPASRLACLVLCHPCHGAQVLLLINLPQALLRGAVGGTRGRPLSGEAGKPGRLAGGLQFSAAGANCRPSPTCTLFLSSSSTAVRLVSGGGAERRTTSSKLGKWTGGRGEGEGAERALSGTPATTVWLEGDACPSLPARRPRPPASAPSPRVGNALLDQLLQRAPAVLSGHRRRAHLLFGVRKW